MDGTHTEQEKIYTLILVHTPGITPVNHSRLLALFGSPRRIVDAADSELAAAGLKQETIHSLRHPDWDSIEADVRWLEAPGHSFVTLMDADYPPLLKEIPDPPPGLFVCGNVSALHATQVAIVGSRNPTPGGRRTAAEFAQNLGGNGLTITSGLAMGIDSVAHRGALQANAITNAVLGHGLDSVYPPANRSLAEKICERGALVSEFPLKTRPIPANFPRRNRIISGLAVGTLVVEAALRSGSLITARLAMEQGREVFAIPGSIHNPLAHGCHGLIREGAKLTEQIADILDEIGQLDAVVKQSNAGRTSREILNETLDEDCKLLLHNIGYDPVTMDFLIEETGVSTKLAIAALLNLELQNLIESLPGGGFVRKN